MRKILLPFFLFICVSFNTVAQNKVPSSTPSPSKGQELIIYMPHVDKLKTLQTVVSMVDGKDIQAVAFCDDLKCLLLRVHGAHPEKAQRLLDDFKNAGFEFVIKSNATIQQVLNNSNAILTAETYWQ